MQGEDKLAIIIVVVAVVVVMKKHTIDKTEISPKEATLEDLSNGSPPITGGSPMLIDEVQH